MAARIVLVRHGPSAHVDEGGPVDHSAMLVWRDSYDAAGIRADAQPPIALRDLVAKATHLISSDLLRAVESAERLAPHREIQMSELLREAPLAIPSWPTRLPFLGWVMLIHLAWQYRIVRGTDPPEADRARAAAAAEWLAGLVSDGSTAVVVTHGVFRRLLAKDLVSRGWKATRQDGYRHWSAWTMSKSS
jgi:broad specificity phosphatase PhoE